MVSDSLFGGREGGRSGWKGGKKGLLDITTHLLEGGAEAFLHLREILLIADPVFWQFPYAAARVVRLEGALDK